jgi:carbonic anhydrase/acetyltransferase-like protein (isoleucine patch superfamily)
VLDLGQPRIHPTAFLAPGVEVWGAVEIEADAVLMFGVVVRAELDRIRIGRQTNLQDQVVVHCDEGFPCLIGARVTVGHGAVVHGATLGDQALIGVGAVVLNGAVVGEGAMVAAGSVVPEGLQIPPWTLALGVPAKPTRPLSEEDVKRAAHGVDHYLELSTAYRSRLNPTR